MENLLNLTKQILKRENLWPKKFLGQNFLVSEKILDKIAKAAEIEKDETILEIGPGLGFLTERLAKKAKLVLAIEKDYKLVEFLRKKFKNFPNVKIIHVDILKFNFNDLDFPKIKVTANLPYNITSITIRLLLESQKFSEISLMMQKEVAERLTAPPGNSNRGILTVAVEFYAEAKILFGVSENNFWPEPEVESAFIQISPRQLPENIKPKSFFRLVKAGFSAKRRQIHNSLSAVLHTPKDEVSQMLTKAKIDSNLRAEDLTLENWKELYNVIASEEAKQSDAGTLS